MDLALRIALAVVWCAAGLWTLGHVRRSAALLAGLACLAAGAADLTRWHVHLLRLARTGLHDAGLYHQRTWVKLGIGAAGLALLLLLVRGVQRGLVGVPQGLRLCLVASVAWLLFLLALTGFLDDLLPSALLRQPGRGILEALFALPALWGALRWRRRPEGPDAR